METRYLTLEIIFDIHKRQIEEFGGTPGVRDAGLIEAALLRPQTGYYSDVLEEAAALWESLTMNHGLLMVTNALALPLLMFSFASTGIICPQNPRMQQILYLAQLKAANLLKTT